MNFHETPKYLKGTSSKTTAEIINSLEYPEYTEIEKLQKLVEIQSKQIHRLTNEFHELLGGLFHNVKQAGSLENAAARLFGTYEQGFGDDPNGWESWPTTRQGFELERRVDELEDKLAQFGELFPKNRDVNHKLSECLDERKKSSASLCGNE
jgi:hypothetical protein